jgi:predicted nucleic acid-binding protein
MGLSCLIDPTAPVVIDASTVINLNATACGPRILTAIPNPFIITDVVQGELLEDRRSGRNDGQMVAELIASGLISVAKLDDLTESHFVDLVIGRGEATLDDGEAATIAYGVEKGAITLIDERKATRLCGRQYPSLTVGNSFDVLTHGAVLTALGEGGVADAVFNALRLARMRVPPSALTWVVALIGPERAAMCECLPRASRAERNYSSVETRILTGGTP